MKKYSFILIISIFLTLFIFSGCNSTSADGDTDSNSQTIEPENNSVNDTASQPIIDIIDETKIPSHYLYYSITEDYPEYFYLWPSLSKGILTGDNLEYYNVYGDVSIKALQTEYPTDVEIIQAEVFLPSDGYAENALHEIGIFDALGLEKLVDGIWTPVAFDGKSNYYFNLISEEYTYWLRSYIPSEGKTVIMELKTNSLYEPLNPGHYRIVLFLDDVTCRYAEFDIK